MTVLAFGMLSTICSGRDIWMSERNDAGIKEEVFNALHDGCRVSGCRGKLYFQYVSLQPKVHWIGIFVHGQLSENLEAAEMRKGYAQGQVESAVVRTRRRVLGQARWRREWHIPIWAVTSHVCGYVYDPEIAYLLPILILAARMLRTDSNVHNTSRDLALCPVKVHSGPSIPIQAQIKQAGAPAREARRHSAAGL
ncbi:hypothetical protein B0H17DRAFT_1134231 [Mycena rosella]|uniref:Uncharacterized protein n=1 Tax=Mycena rosella TaxID=1033263 RepID=A0AAD7DFW2_MYCRO|nr:hypothetical protein B0H17DRAFT_1134231 [Mycena rosella]